MKNTHHLKVRFGDTDAAGIVFYPNYYKWQDQSTHELFEAAGYSISKLQKEDKVIIPLLEAFCQFKSPLFFEDEVSVQTEVREINKKIFKVEHLFFREEELVAEGYELRAWTSTASEKPKAIPIPESVQETLLDD
ncbi:acyl-CoA thioester hydrolase [Halobacillus dabanensis]|uniref:Acyl-CoA thioester hydrolase n=1 Tax=Halobacillus dabanensis TaxID=240302 RepID=A0A1I3W9X4_HALDA|nr:thioesterase family protein [Halobacillus dabanensis]SFK04368.1 acyl-CoA thioester hydrolase [Halobacillus dabanensis]